MVKRPILFVSVLLLLSLMVAQAQALPVQRHNMDFQRKEAEFRANVQRQESEAAAQKAAMQQEMEELKAKRTEEMTVMQQTAIKQMEERQQAAREAFAAASAQAKSAMNDKQSLFTHSLDSSNQLHLPELPTLSKKPNLVPMDILQVPIKNIPERATAYAAQQAESAKAELESRIQQLETALLEKEKQIVLGTLAVIGFVGTYCAASLFQRLRRC